MEQKTSGTAGCSKKASRQSNDRIADKICIM